MPLYSQKEVKVLFLLLPLQLNELFAPVGPAYAESKNKCGMAKRT